MAAISSLNYQQAPYIHTHSKSSSHRERHQKRPPEPQSLQKSRRPDSRTSLRHTPLREQALTHRPTQLCGNGGSGGLFHGSGSGGYGFQGSSLLLCVVWEELSLSVMRCWTMLKQALLRAGNAGVFLLVSIGTGMIGEGLWLCGRGFGGVERHVRDGGKACSPRIRRSGSWGWVRCLAHSWQVVEGVGVLKCKNQGLHRG